MSVTRRGLPSFATHPETCSPTLTLVVATTSSGRPTAYLIYSSPMSSSMSMRDPMRAFMMFTDLSTTVFIMSSTLIIELID